MDEYDQYQPYNDNGLNDTDMQNSFDHRDQEPDDRKPHGRRSRRPFIVGLLVGLLCAFVICGVAASVLIMNSGFVVPTSTGNETSAINDVSTKKIENLQQLINSKYYKSEEVTTEQLQEGMYKGLIESLDDPYSVYYTADEIKEVSSSLEGTFEGIGAYLSMDTQYNLPKISGVFEDSPAQKAGLKVDDIIVKVDGEDTTGKTLDEVVSKVRGEEGTTVTLTVFRQGESDYLDIEVTRAKIDSPTVSGKMLDDQIGYLSIAEFDDVTTDQFTAAFNDLKEQGMKALILDLRNNPGGNVDTVTAIANEILPEGLVFYMVDKDGNETDYTCDGADFDLPLAVLVNGNTASAAEILSGAIQDAKIGTIIGTQTYGKGVVQTIYSMTDGSAVKLTVANYYTRGGQDINKVGITPDVVLEFDTDAYEEDGTDNQLEKAIEIVKEEM